MSLRARMGLAGGLAVALAVIAVAASAYAGTRSALAGPFVTTKVKANASGNPSFGA